MILHFFKFKWLAKMVQMGNYDYHSQIKENTKIINMGIKTLILDF